MKLSASLQMVYFVGGFLNFLMATENLMASVDRILEYVNIPEIEPEQDKPQYWPSQGKIWIHN